VGKRREREDNLKAASIAAFQQEKVAKWNESGQFAEGKSHLLNGPRIIAEHLQHLCSRTLGSHFL
jgi:hypothetical protein